MLTWLLLWCYLTIYFLERHGKKGDSEERDQEVPSHAEHHQQQGSPGTAQQQQQGEALPEQQSALAAEMQQPPLAGSPPLPLIYPDFDINSIFNIENIPGLSVSSHIIYLYINS